jgi:hypothetical protein
VKRAALSHRLKSLCQNATEAAGVFAAFSLSFNVWNGENESRPNQRFGAVLTCSRLDVGAPRISRTKSSMAMIGRSQRPRTKVNSSGDDIEGTSKLFISKSIDFQNPIIPNPITSKA